MAVVTPSTPGWLLALLQVTASLDVSMVIVRGCWPALLVLSTERRLNRVGAPRSSRIHSAPVWLELVVHRVVAAPSRAALGVPADAVAVQPLRSAANSPRGDIQSSWVSHPPTLVPRRLTVAPVPDPFLSTDPLALMKSDAVIAAASASRGGVANVVTNAAATNVATIILFFMILLDHYQALSGTRARTLVHGHSLPESHRFVHCLK